MNWRIFRLLERLKDGLWHTSLPLYVGEKTMRNALDLKYIRARTKKGHVSAIHITRLGRKALRDDEIAAGLGVPI